MFVLKPEQIQEAVDLLRQGGVLVYPTETSYALGCDATNDQAVAKIFTIKGRPSDKGLPLILPPDQDPDQYVCLSSRARALIAAHWPGPLNIVSLKRSSSPVSASCETQGTQCVRQSSHPVARALAQALGRPLVATSANRSGNASLYQAEQIKAEFNADNSVDAMIDAGDLPVVPASTIVKVDGDDMRLIRLGEIIIV
jgi:L-threonylcarbamoyladenylate synthase